MTVRVVISGNAEHRGEKKGLEALYLIFLQNNGF